MAVYKIINIYLECEVFRIHFTHTRNHLLAVFQFSEQVLQGLFCVAFSKSFSLAKVKLKPWQNDIIAG